MHRTEQCTWHIISVIRVIVRFLTPSLRLIQLLPRHACNTFLHRRTRIPILKSLIIRSAHPLVLSDSTEFRAMTNRPSWLLKDSDILILVVGQTGTGKSQFINTAAGTNAMEVNHGLLSFPDLRVQHVICTHPTYTHFSEPPFRVVFVDTPGLDGTLTEDSDVIQLIAKWIDIRCNKNMELAILYLVEPRQRRFPLLKHLHANDAIRDITVAVGTKFQSADLKEPKRDQDHNGTYESAWNIVDHIRDHYCAARTSEVEEFFRQLRPRERNIPNFFKPFFSFLLS